MTDTSPLVLVLSGRRTAEQLKAAGYRVGLVASSVPFDLMLLVDVPIEGDLDDWADIRAKVAAVHARNPIDAVVTHLENRLPLAGLLREDLRLDTGITEQAARDCEDKARTNQLLATAGVGVARGRVVGSADEAVQAIGELGLPVVVKPRDASSAAGLQLCDDETGLRSPQHAILDDGRDSALLEEYLKGDEIVVFATRSRGRTHVISCLDAEVGPPPKFVKLGGRHPSRAAEGRLTELTELTDRALAAVGLDNWVATVQLMLTADGPRVIEINPRVPGGQTVELIAATTGYEPTLAAVEAALGREPTRGEARAAVGWYRGVVFDEPGRLHYRADAEQLLSGWESPVPPVIDLDVEPGDEVLPLNHARGGVFGRIIVCGDDDETVGRDYGRVLDALQLRLEPLPEEDESASWRPHSRCC